MRRCVYCGKKAVFWLAAGDFVVGYDEVLPVCTECLKEVLPLLVYESERWKRQPRFWPISGAELNDEARRLLNEELRRCGLR